MTADRRNYIKTPWKLRFRRFLQGWPMQVLMFLGVAVAVGYLWQSGTPNSIGQAATVLVNVSSTADGKLLPMYELGEGQWNKFDKVYKGQVVARLDDSALRAELATFQQETEDLRAQLAATQWEIAADRSKLSRDHLKEAAELAREVEQHRLDILDRLTELEQDRLELGRLETQVKLAVRAHANGMVGPGSVQELQALHGKQTTLVANHSRAYAQAQENHRAALKRLQAHPALDEPAIETVLTPLRVAISAAEARVEHMHAQLAALEIRSPINGKITAVHCYPGQGLRTGEWIVTIAADKVDHIVAYVRPDQQARPVPGSPVGVRLRMPSSTLVMATAQEVGSQWEPLPEQLRRDQNTPEMVLPVRVSIPDGLELMPGELVDITFFPERREGI
jgi:multidrug resistance efflux pump